jgi:uncharacterized protein (UPF0210 family)
VAGVGGINHNSGGYNPAAMNITHDEISETIRMVQMESLDIRTVTLGVHLGDCAHPDVTVCADRVRAKILRVAAKLASAATDIENRYGIPIVNRRISVTPVSLFAAACDTADYAPIARALDEAGGQSGADFVGGFSALVQKGMTASDERLIRSMPEAFSTTARLCGSVNVGSTKAGINMDAIALMGRTIKEIAARTADAGGAGCCRLVTFANAVEDNPFMAGAFHGPGEPELAINVGVSGPGVVRSALERLPADADLGAVAETIKRTAFKITRMGELVGQEMAERLGVRFGIVDLSLAPTPLVGDSVAHILELMGLEKVGVHGSTAALAILVDALKRGGLMATSRVGGLSGAFIAVSEDAGMADAAAIGALGLDKLEAMTSVCSVGLDMVVVPGDTTAETVSAILADECAIGVINNKTTGVRIIPVPGRKAGEWVEFGGLLGRSPILPVSRWSSAGFIRRGGHIPAPVRSLTN